MSMKRFLLWVLVFLVVAGVTSGLGVMLLVKYHDTLIWLITGYFCLALTLVIFLTGSYLVSRVKIE